VYSVLAFAFQCGFPRPWEVRRGKCAKGGPLISAIALNMLSDIVLAGWIMPVLRTLKMEEEKRRTAAILFGIRIVYVWFFRAKLVLTQCAGYLLRLVFKPGKLQSPSIVPTPLVSRLLFNLSSS